MGTVFSPAALVATPAEMLAKYDGMPAEMVFMHEELRRVDMNVGNANSILSALGLKSSDDTGECPAEDFLARVMLSLAEQPADEGMPAYADAPNWNIGARPEGALQRHLHDLYELAEFCRDMGMLVAWA